MKKIIPFIIILFSLFLYTDTKATHILGGDCTWKCLGNDTYEIRVVIYRRCTDGTVALSAVVPTITSDSCGNAYNVNPGGHKSWIVEEITPVCSQAYRVCPLPNSSSNPSNPSVPIGFEKHTFTYKVFLGGAYANCCWYKIKFEQVARVSNITTGYADQVFYTESWLNRCLSSCDNGPEFRNPPMQIKCAGQDVVFNDGVYDADHDSISYAMAIPLVSAGSGNLFTSPWSPTYPLTCLGGNNPNAAANPPTGFNLDPITGDMLFRPMQTQITVIKVMVSEWRRDTLGKYRVIGKTARDVEFLILQTCNNKLPSLSGPYTFEACSGQQICITINTNDQDSPDTTSISWNKGIPGGTWSTNNATVKHATAQFCWTPSDSAASTLPYYFTAIVNDNHCPLQGTTTHSYEITVKPGPKNTRTYNRINCGVYDFIAKPVSNYFAGAAYKWYVPVLIPGPATTLYDTKDSTRYTFTQPGTYLVRNTMTFNGCTTNYFDTLVVDTNFSLPPKPIITKSFSTLLCSTTGSSYQWFLNNVPIPAGTNSSYQATITGSYIVRVTGANGCSSFSDPFYFTVGIGANSLSANIRISPNPFHDQLVIEALQLGKPLLFYLYDLQGKLIFQEFLNTKGSVLFNTVSLSNGLYLLQVSDDESQLILKIAKQ